ALVAGPRAAQPPERYVPERAGRRGGNGGPRAGDGCGRGVRKIGCMPNGLGFTVRQMDLLRDHGGRDHGGPVDAERAGGGGRRGGVETGVAGQRELDRGVGERAAYLALVGASGWSKRSRRTSNSPNCSVPPSTSVSKAMACSAFSSMSRPVSTIVV